MLLTNPIMGWRADGNEGMYLSNSKPTIQLFNVIPSITHKPVTNRLDN